MGEDGHVDAVDPGDPDYGIDISFLYDSSHLPFYSETLKIISPSLNVER